ncbi:class I SAM-dependent methyltransferase [Amycolatopsis acidicola]|uniref:Class I SAM-dependent methyltransferase n=2 Tax=Amycolatopsis acidicola TaxID=2596893 RepID=A0A5N0UYZ3_9PSEU|nr:class I SAM-dependent methyltransferase [Amycolatopsis acidicola]
MPEAYDHRLAAAVFRPFAVDLAERATRLRPRRVLEIAAGTGVLTRELAPHATVVATDLSDAMVEYGARQVPGAQWRQADARRLPFADGQFDLVACQFGVMFLPGKPAAYAEMRRVLAPGGHLLFNTWGEVGEHGFARPLANALADVFPENPPQFVTAIPHGYHDPGAVRADLRAGGLGAVSAETVTLEGRADSAAAIATGFCTGTPLRAEIEARAEPAESVAAVAEHMTAELGEGPVTARMTAHVFQVSRS